jgi:hypothetical protein
MYFSTRILKPVFNGNSRMIALSIVIFKLPLTALPAIVIERSGTRPILLFSSFAMIIWALFLAYGLNADSGPMAAVGMVSFVAFFSFGLGPVAWVVLSEVMPREATTAAGALGIALNWSMNFVMVSGGQGGSQSCSVLGIQTMKGLTNLRDRRSCPFSRL